MRLVFDALINDDEIDQFANECAEEDLIVLSASLMNSNHLQVNSYGVASGIATFHPTLYDIL